jgi:hypothetical protein
MPISPSLRSQLELAGLEESIRSAEQGATTSGEATRQRRALETASDLMSRLPEPDELAFLHSGLCQTYLPHVAPERDDAIWTRKAGRFTLMVTPGAIDGGVERPMQAIRRRRAAKAAGTASSLPATEEIIPPASFVGVPYGPKARLVLIYLQSEGLKSRTVSLGSSLSAFIKNLDLPPTTGPRGSIAAFREQILRISRCTFTLQWAGTGTDGAANLNLRDIRIASGLELALSPKSWNGIVELDEAFHRHLQEHAVPLDRRAIKHLAGNSLALDLYALFAYRLPRLQGDLQLRWSQLQQQLGSADRPQHSLAQRIKQALPQVKTAYPVAQVEATRHGLVLRPSPPAVPRERLVQGFRLLKGGA